MAEKHRIRQFKFQLWLLEEEYAMLTKSAYEFGLSRADYLRKLILYGSIPGRRWTTDKEKAKEIIYELNRIGNNINQIAYNSNSRKYVGSDDVKELRANFYDLLNVFGYFYYEDSGKKDQWKEKVNNLREKYLD